MEGNVPLLVTYNSFFCHCLLWIQSALLSDSAVQAQEDLEDPDLGHDET